MTAPALRLICPGCRGELEPASGALRCARCRSEYPYEAGFPNLIMEGRFDDAPDAARSAYEELSNEFTATNYLIPLFGNLFAGAVAPPRLLSVGCGNGADVDALCRAGFDAVGVDCGNRSAAWHARSSRDRLYLANGKRLPFEDEIFDVTYCGCVFPHVGVQGDSRRVTENFREDRLALACEMARVLKPGGYAMVSSPNRLCPVDLFHGRSAERALPVVNPPCSRFLLSSADYRALFRQAGCSEFRLLPPAGYWGFINRKATWRGRITAWPIQTVFRLASFEALSFLRELPLSPWIIMLAKKASR